MEATFSLAYLMAASTASAALAAFVASASAAVNPFANHVEPLVMTRRAG
jgi:hypothetical protein